MADRGAWTWTSGWLVAGLLLTALGCGDDDSGNGADHDAGVDAATGSGGSNAGSGGSNAGSGGAHADAGSAHDAGAGHHDAGTTHDSGGDEDAGSTGPSWSAEVHPALVNGCGGCHGDPSDNDGGIVIGRPGGPGEGTGDAPGKFAVSDAHAAYENARPFAIPGDAEHSNLYIKISQDAPSTGGQRMPPALRQWDDPDIQLVRDWIAAGALEN